MKTLLLLRHAKSSWKDATLDDRDRPLNRRGVKAASSMGRFIRAEGLMPDAILCSTSLRTRETLQLVLAEWAFPPAIVMRDDLYHADPATLTRIVASVVDQPDRLLVIGHNPGLEEFVRLVTGCDERLPTAALVKIELPLDRWSELATTDQQRSELEKPQHSGRLIHVWRPRELE